MQIKMHVRIIKIFTPSLRHIFVMFRSMFHFKVSNIFWNDIKVFITLNRLKGAIELILNFKFLRIGQLTPYGCGVILLAPLGRHFHGTLQQYLLRVEHSLHLDQTILVPAIVLRQKRPVLAAICPRYQVGHRNAQNINLSQLVRLWQFFGFLVADSFRYLVVDFEFDMFVVVGHHELEVVAPFGFLSCIQIFLIFLETFPNFLFVYLFIPSINIYRLYLI